MLHLANVIRFGPAYWKYKYSDNLWAKHGLMIGTSRHWLVKCFQSSNFLDWLIDDFNLNSNRATKITKWLPFCLSGVNRQVYKLRPKLRRRLGHGQPVCAGRHRLLRGLHHFTKSQKQVQERSLLNKAKHTTQTKIIVSKLQFFCGRLIFLNSSTDWKITKLEWNWNFYQGAK